MDENYEGLLFGDSGNEEANRKVENALKYAHEIRQFEIDLYWRRTLYFWGLILALFTGYGLLLPTECSLFSCSSWMERIVGLVIAIFGFFISLAWTFLEKGSKAYQQNWELHIDFLEDTVTGKLHKTLIGKKKEYYSVSKINRAIIYAFCFLWWILIHISIINLLIYIGNQLQGSWSSPHTIGLLTIIASLLLVIFFCCISRHAKRSWKTKLPNPQAAPWNNAIKNNMRIFQRKAPTTPTEE